MKKLTHNVNQVLKHTTSYQNILGCSIEFTGTLYCREQTLELVPWENKPEYETVVAIVHEDWWPRKCESEMNMLNEIKGTTAKEYFVYPKGVDIEEPTYMVVAGPKHAMIIGCNYSAPCNFWVEAIVRSN